MGHACVPRVLHGLCTTVVLHNPCVHVYDLQTAQSVSVAKCQSSKAAHSVATA